VPPASPSTYIEIGTVARETVGANVAPTIAPVAKMTAEFAPVSACAAASRSTLARARESLKTSSAAVTSIIGCFYPAKRQGVAGVVAEVSLIPTYYEGACASDQPMQTGARHAYSSGGFAEHQGEIIGRHHGNLDKRKTRLASEFLHGFDVTHAPFGIAFTKT
jgi:hypothetical protein